MLEELRREERPSSGHGVGLDSSAYPRVQPSVRRGLEKGLLEPRVSGVLFTHGDSCLAQMVEGGLGMLEAEYLC